MDMDNAAVKKVKLNINSSWLGHVNKKWELSEYQVEEIEGLFKKLKITLQKRETV